MSDKLPTVLLTRPERQSQRFADALARRLGPEITCAISPVIRIEPIEPWADLSPYRALIFTSENGVQAVADHLREWAEPVYCVGDRTAHAARDAGLRAVSAGGNVEDLLARLKAEHPPGPWAHVSGEHSRGDLAERLSQSGYPTTRHVAYRQVPVALSGDAIHLLRTKSVVLPVFSPRSARLLSAAVPARAPAPVLVAISDATADAWAGPLRAIRIADHPNGNAMVEAVEAAVKSDSHY